MIGPDRHNHKRQNHPHFDPIFLPGTNPGNPIQLPDPEYATNGTVAGNDCVKK